MADLRRSANRTACWIGALPRRRPGATSSHYQLDRSAVRQAVRLLEPIGIARHQHHAAAGRSFELKPGSEEHIRIRMPSRSTPVHPLHHVPAMIAATAPGRHSTSIDPQL